MALKQKESIINLNKLIDKMVRVKFSGGREVTGILKGFDSLVNIVIDETTEFIRNPDDPYLLTNKTRSLGLTMCRGGSVICVCPMDGYQEISNPYLQDEIKVID